MINPPIHQKDAAVSVKAGQIWIRLQIDVSKLNRAQDFIAIDNAIMTIARYMVEMEAGQ